MSTIISINSGDLITNSRADINTNFANLNADKLEAAALTGYLQTTDIGSTVQAHSAVLDGTTASYTASDASKLAGIASGATVNSSDAALLARANHTGTQTASTISDFNAAADARIAASSVNAHADVVITSPTSGQVLKFDGTNWINDTDVAGGAPTWGSITGTLSSQTDLNSALAGKASTTHTHVAADVTNFQTTVSANTDVAANTAARHTHSNLTTLDAITAAYTTAEQTKLSGIATGATVNDTDANLKNRANHTGTQLAATISDFSTAADARIAAASVNALADVIITTPANGQALTYNGTNWVNSSVSASAAWGSITGTLSSQTDLQSALDAKASKSLSNVFTGSNTFSSGLNATDSFFRISDNTDSTKSIAFEASAITTGLTRTLTVPDANTTIVGTDVTQTLTNKTLTTPTIADFTNANHAHTSAATGGQLSITAATTGTLPETRGGTNQTTYALGDMLYASGANTLAKLPAGTEGQILNMVSGVPSWQAHDIFCVLNATNPLTATTAAQKLFNSTTNGAVTLAAGTYLFEGLVFITGMSATNGNLGFNILGAGTAVIGSSQFHVHGRDTTVASTASAVSGAAALSTTLGSPVVATATGTVFNGKLTGVIRVTTAGTLIPSVLLQTAAAAVVQPNTYILFRYLGSQTITTQGTWS